MSGGDWCEVVWDCEVPSKQLLHFFQLFLTRSEGHSAVRMVHIMTGSFTPYTCPLLPRVRGGARR